MARDQYNTGASRTTATIAEGKPETIDRAGCTEESRPKEESRPAEGPGSAEESRPAEGPGSTEESRPAEGPKLKEISAISSGSNRSLVVLGNWMDQTQRGKISRLARENASDCSFYDNETEAEAAGALKEAEVVFGFAPRTAANSKALKWLCLQSAGADFFLKPGALHSDDVILTNSSGAYGTAMAEHMIMQVLMLIRRMPEFQDGIRRREWLRPRAQCSVKDSRVTVLGAGDIGSCFARRMKAFEPETIVAVNRSGKSTETAYDRVLPWTQLDQILPETDILAMSLPSTRETRGILSAERIALLPDTAYIINVGRGDAIDEKALTEALNAGRLAGAALDVMQHEPLPEDDPLWETRNMILTPHVAGNMTIEYTKNKIVDMFCEDLPNYAKGRPMHFLVDKKLGY